MHIRTKFLLVFVCVIFFISTLILLTTTVISRRIFTEYSIDMSTELVDQVAQDIGNRTNDLEEFTYYICQNTQIKDQLFFSQSIDAPYELEIIQSKVNSTINSLVGNNVFFRSAMVMTPQKRYFWWEKEAPTVKAEALNASMVKMYFNQRLLNKLPSDNSPLWAKSPVFKNEVILIRPIIDELNINHFLGYVIFTFNTEYLKGIDSPDLILGKQNIAIVDQENNLFVQSNIIDLTLYHSLIRSPEYETKKLNYLFVKNKKQKYLLIENLIDFTDWKLICIIPQTLLEEGMKSLQLFIVIITLVSIVLVIMIACHISKSITKNIRILEKNIVKVELGDFDINIQPASYDEIGLIGLRINQMAKQIQSLINRLYISEMAKQKIETEVLKAQINPHFLYNTLGSIKWLAISKGQNDIADVVTSLINLLKFSIKRKAVYQKLSEEIVYIQNYMEIQKISLDGNINVIYEIGKGIEDYYVLNFMLQPIVENAIYHGLELRKGHATITIKAYVKEENLYLEVNDNGKGMDADKMDEIMNDSKTKDYSGLNSIGIWNVNQRIKIYFGEAYGLTFNSRVGVGTKVLFALPIKTELEGEQSC